MKVLHVIPSVGPARGGPSVVLRTMARGLVRAGVKIDVVATDDNGTDRLEVPHGEPVAADGARYFYFPRQTRFYNFSWPLASWLSRHVGDYDLLHIHGLFSYAAIPAAYCARRREVPYVVRPLGVLNRWGMRNRRPWFKKISFPVIEKPILKNAAVVHYTAEEERMQAAELGVRQSACVIANAVEAPQPGRIPAHRLRAEYPRLADRLVILFCSRLDPKKGLDILLPAFVEVRARHPRAMLAIAGDGDPTYAGRLRRQAARLGVASDIVWLGYLSGEAKWAAMAGADLFVLPSYSENFGVAVVEAMACGLPVIVSDQVAIHREISESQAGLVVPCDKAMLAGALASLIENEELRRAMGASGRQLAEEKFSPGATTQKLLAMYRQISRSAAERAATILEIEQEKTS